MTNNDHGEGEGTFRGGLSHRLHESASAYPSSRRDPYTLYIHMTYIRDRRRAPSWPHPLATPAATSLTEFSGYIKARRGLRTVIVRARLRFEQSYFVCVCSTASLSLRLCVCHLRLTLSSATLQPSWKATRKNKHSSTCNVILKILISHPHSNVDRNFVRV